MRTYKTEGIILKRSNFGEAERLLTIFTKHYGKIKARAPGIRKTLSRKAPHLELFNHCSIFLSNGKNLDIVTEAQTINNFSGIRKDLKKVGVAYYFCELVDRLSAEKVEHNDVYELLNSFLGKLELGNLSDLSNLSQDFANQLLWNLGFLPKDRKLEEDNLERFIESIIERKIKSKKIFS